MQNFRELSVWQKAHQLTLAVYRATSGFPRAEVFGLTSQIRRACVSIASNLAEGRGRGGDHEFARFCAIARGSATELDYQLLLAKDLAYLNNAEYEVLARYVNEVERMLTGLMQKLKANG